MQTVCNDERAPLTPRGVALMRGMSEPVADSDDAIVGAFTLYAAARRIGRPLDPMSLNAEAEEEAADLMTNAAQAMLHRVALARAATLRGVVVKLALAVLESDTGCADSPQADLQTRLTASAARDVAAILGDDDLAAFLAECRAI